MFLFDLQAVDYESRSSYSFSVEVLNPIVDPRFLRRGPFKDRASIRVAVLDADEPPRFSRARYRMDVSENCPAACTVGRISAVDPDTGLTNNIRYTLKNDFSIVYLLEYIWQEIIFQLFYFRISRLIQCYLQFICEIY